MQTIINLADNEEKIANCMQKSDFQSPNFLKLYEQGSVIPLAMNIRFKFRSRNI